MKTENVALRVVEDRMRQKTNAKATMNSLGELRKDHVMCLVVKNPILQTVNVIYTTSSIVIENATSLVVGNYIFH